MARELATTERPAGASADDRVQESGIQRGLGRVGEGRILLGLLLVVLVSHSLNMFRYPLYLGDEGIYLEQAWSVLREGKLSPYTYFYDHAPAGWLLLAWWIFLLPLKFRTFGMAVNAGRVLMLLLDLVSTALLYRIARKLAHSDAAAVITVVIFSLSPLALYYQRMVLLDNIMVFWVLVSLHTILSDDDRILTLVFGGAAFGIATLTKENAVFFAPVLAYLLYARLRGSHRWRFALAGWGVSALMVVSFYPLYAVLKNELLPSWSTIFTNAPAEHVAMLSTFLWQLGRHGGSVLDPYSDFWTFFWTKWWAKDPVIIVAGVSATVANLTIGWLGRRRGHLVAALLSVAFIFYLIRGSVILEFYVVPLLPFLALNVGLLADEALKRLPSKPALLALGGGLTALGFVFTTNPYTYDAYTLDLTQLQAQQLAYIRANIPTNAQILIDDDLWVDLHDPARGQPVYPYANSHWKIAQDPAIRDKLLKADWRNLDYLVMSNKLAQTFQINYAANDLPVQALAHSEVIWSESKGDVHVEIRKVIKQSDTTNSHVAGQAGGSQ